MIKIQDAILTVLTDQPQGVFAVHRARCAAMGVSHRIGMAQTIVALDSLWRDRRAQFTLNVNGAPEWRLP